MAAGLLRAHGFRISSKKILLEDIGLQRGAGFAGDNHQRLGQVDLVAGGHHLRRVGGVDDAQRGKAGLLAKGGGQHLGAEAGAAHAQQQNRLEVGAFTSAPSAAKAARSFCCRSTMSIQPIHFSSPSWSTGWGPFARSGNFVVGCQSADGRIHGTAKIGGNRKLNVHITLDCA